MSTGAPDLRASDADREAVAEQLRAHCAAGRLDVEELEERLAAALSARTLGDLDGLLVDLPGQRAAAPPATPAAQPPPPRAGAPGRVRFHQRHELDVSRSRAFRQALEQIVPAMMGAGYDLVARNEPELLVFERQRHPAWVPVVCILAFPFGLVALTVRETQRVVVALNELDEGRTELVVQGTAPRAVRRAFADLNAG